MIRRMILPALALGLSACGPTGGAGTTVRPALGVGRPHSPPGTIEGVIGQNQVGLAQMFGAADADVTEGLGRKLQYLSGICVLDAYLYPPKGGGVPTVTYIDTRQRNGAPIDQASCIAALKRRDGGK